MYYFTIVHHQSSKFNYWWFSFAALGSPANPLQFHHQLWWKLLKIERVWKLFRNSLIYLINCSLLFFSSSILQFQWLVIFLGSPINFQQVIPQFEWKSLKIERVWKLFPKVNKLGISWRNLTNSHANDVIATALVIQCCDWIFTPKKYRMDENVEDESK